MQIRAQISDESAAQIDDQITDLSSCAFQVIPKEQKKQHVVDQMLDAMYAVGKRLPAELRETAQGGCATTPAACAACGLCG